MLILNGVGIEVDEDAFSDHRPPSSEAGQRISQQIEAGTSGKRISLRVRRHTLFGPRFVRLSSISGRLGEIVPCSSCLFAGRCDCAARISVDSDR